VRSRSSQFKTCLKSSRAFALRRVRQCDFRVRNAVEGTATPSPGQEIAIGRVQHTENQLYLFTKFGTLFLLFPSSTEAAMKTTPLEL